MSNTQVAGDYYSKVVKRLQSSSFKISADVRFRDQSFTYVAKKTAFRSERGGFVGTFFVFAELEDLDLTTLRHYSRKGFGYACRRCRIPLPPGFGRCIECYSVALTRGVAGAVAETMRTTEPPRHWAAAEIPVICDLGTRQLCYFEGTPLWRSLYWDDNRETIMKMLNPCDQNQA